MEEVSRPELFGDVPIRHRRILDHVDGPHPIGIEWFVEDIEPPDTHLFHESAGSHKQELKALPRVGERERRCAGHVLGAAGTGSRLIEEVLEPPHEPRCQHADEPWRRADTTPPIRREIMFRWRAVIAHSLATEARRQGIDIGGLGTDHAGGTLHTVFDLGQCFRKPSCLFAAAHCRLTRQRAEGGFQMVEATCHSCEMPLEAAIEQAIEVGGEVSCGADLKLDLVPKRRECSDDVGGAQQR